MRSQMGNLPRRGVRVDSSSTDLVSLTMRVGLRSAPRAEGGQACANAGSRRGRQIRVKALPLLLQAAAWGMLVLVVSGAPSRSWLPDPRQASHRHLVVTPYPLSQVTELRKVEGSSAATFRFLPWPTAERHSDNRANRSDIRPTGLRRRTVLSTRNATCPTEPGARLNDPGRPYVVRPTRPHHQRPLRAPQNPRDA
jgi:hypothetical protein